LKLQDYDFTLKHILGKTNTKADILSWKEQVNTKEDNKDVQVLKDEMWIRKTMAKCYELRSLGLDNRTTLVLSNTRELDRVHSTK